MDKLVTTGIFCIIFSFSHNVAATNYFSWNVEDQPTSISGAPSYSAMRLEGDTTIETNAALVHEGTASMKLTVEGDDGGNNQMGADLNLPNAMPFKMIGSPALYYRWYMRIETGFSWGGGTRKTKASRTIGQTGVDPRGYTGYLHATGFRLDECGDPGGSLPGGACPSSNGVTIPYNLTTMDDSRWHEYIMRVKFDSSVGANDAEFDAWVDGVNVGNIRNFDLHGVDGTTFDEAWGAWMVRPFFQLNGLVSDGGVIYVDTFSVDDVFNSTFVSPPAAPGNVTAQ